MSSERFRDFVTLQALSEFSTDDSLAAAKVAFVAAWGASPA